MRGAPQLLGVLVRFRAAKREYQGATQGQVRQAVLGQGEQETMYPSVARELRGELGRRQALARSLEPEPKQEPEPSLARADALALGVSRVREPNPAREVNPAAEAQLQRRGSCPFSTSPKFGRATQWASIWLPTGIGNLRLSTTKTEL